MIINSEREQQISAGEQKIRRALWKSVAVITLFLLIGSAGFYWLKQGPVECPTDSPVSVVPKSPSPSGDRLPPPVLFHDITDQAGISFVHVNGAYGERLMPEAIASGAAFLDYDNDGDQDLFLVNSRGWTGQESKGTPPTQALYRNDGRGGFTDVTAAAGLALTTYGMGVAVGDYDNDGWIDLYLTTLEENHLFRNEHGRFREVTTQLGVAGPAGEWSTSAAFVDFDNDGDLDIFVGNYVRWSRAIDLEIDFRLTGLGRAYGAPNHFVGTNSRLYRNDGAAGFADVTAQAGIIVNDPVSGLPVGKALGVLVVDYDRDGWQDVIVANDTTRNFLFHNRGNGTFEETGVFDGIAFDRDGKATSGMGIDGAYFRNDRDLGVVIGNFANEMTSLYVTADGATPFADEALLEGLGPSTRLALTFGVLFLDYDLDGRLDLLQANGHLEHEINRVQPSQHHAQPPQVLWNCGEDCPVRFIDVKNSGDLVNPLVGRAATYADIDGDGDLDFLISQNGGRPALFRNDQQLGHHWLRVKLIGEQSNRSAIGARIELIAEGIRQYRELSPTRSFLSQVELPVTFGLGGTSRVESLTVHWPGGHVQEVSVDGVDRLLVVKQAP